MHICKHLLITLRSKLWDGIKLKSNVYIYKCSKEVRHLCEINDDDEIEV